MKRLLFICSQNRLRSPTAERVFSQLPGVEARSAGTDSDATTPISADLIEWAQIILVMEKSHRNRLAKTFSAPLKDKRVIVLEIPDEFEYMDPELVKLLELRVRRYVDI